MKSNRLLRSTIKTLRPEQWYKNLVVFVAIIFAAQLTNPQAWLNSILTYLSFCLLSSAGYIINDLKDIDKDKVHPTKKYRPIATGLISRKVAVILSTFLALTGLAVLLLVNSNALLIGCTYLALVIAYTHILKPHYYIGLIAISLGFVLRAIAGCIALEVLPSIWLLSCVFILALILTTAKKGRHEGLTELSIALLFIYTLYTFQNLLMIATIIPTVYILHRYLKLQPERCKPELLLKDRGLQMALLTWLIMVGLILHIH